MRDKSRWSNTIESLKDACAPMPPPMHMVTRPNWTSRRFISLMICTVSLAPLQPRGWPRAMARH